MDINQGQTLYFKGNNPTGWSTSNSIYSNLEVSGDVSISGNVMGLLDNGAKSGEEGDITDIACNNCFYGLFINTDVISVSDNFLPATNLKQDCYANMFQDCSSLVFSPKLPATTLTKYCYQNMFQNCSSLTNAPALPAINAPYWCYYAMFRNCKSLAIAPILPATTLGNLCYVYMFDGCSSLIASPELPATTLGVNCYRCMFRYCSSLTIPPKLPATTLTNECYREMFLNCSSLTTAPELPATSLVSGCYSSMFYRCKKLNSFKIAYTGDYDSTYFDSWVSGVASSGTFYYNGGQTAQDFQLPSGWTTEKF